MNIAPLPIGGTEILAIAVAVLFLLAVYLGPKLRWWMVGFGFLAAGVVAVVVGIRFWASARPMRVHVPDGSHVEIAIPSHAVIAATKRTGGSKSESTKPVVAEAPSEPPKPAKPRPAWVDAPAGKKGGVYREVVLVGPYSTREECDEHLAARLDAAAKNYVTECLGKEPAERVRLSTAFLREHVLLDQWEEPIQASVGPMVQVHAQLAFDDTARKEADRLWRESEVERRLSTTGGGAGVVLAMVGAVYFYLRLSQHLSDKRRRGLQAGAAVAILGMTTVVARLLA